MRAFSTLTLAAFWSFLSGCGGSSDNSGSKSEFENFADFQQHVAQQSVMGSTDCGTAEIDSSPTEINTCVASAFNQSEPFMAFYKMQGIDSEVAAALTGNAQGQVTLWRFDSNPAGGIPASPGRIYKEDCRDPELSGSLDTGYETLFVCAE